MEKGWRGNCGCLGAWELAASFSTGAAAPARTDLREREGSCFTNKVHFPGLLPDRLPRWLGREEWELQERQDQVNPLSPPNQPAALVLGLSQHHAGRGQVLQGPLFPRRSEQDQAQLWLPSLHTECPSGQCNHLSVSIQNLHILVWLLATHLPTASQGNLLTWGERWLCIALLVHFQV